ncbi:MAG TPA: hypothetical protein VL120_01180 [Solirubrobacteraceae bacterium]|nr:hypothetical protein [Solirubrobacteraceae bacterium]
MSDAGRAGLLARLTGAVAYRCSVARRSPTTTSAVPVTASRARRTRGRASERRARATTTA